MIRYLVPNLIAGKMGINWIVLVFLAVIIIALVLFLIRRNLKDKKTLETFLNHDFNKDKKEEDML